MLAALSDYWGLSGLLTGLVAVAAAIGNAISNRRKLEQKADATSIDGFSALTDKLAERLDKAELARAACDAAREEQSKLILNQQGQISELQLEVGRLQGKTNG